MNSCGTWRCVGRATQNDSAETKEERKEEDTNPAAAPTGAANAAAGKTYVLFEGTILETVLINRLEGQFSVLVERLLSTDVYSNDRQHLLVPAGSKLLGETKKVDTFGQTRLAVVFHRILMPDGYSGHLDQFKGLDQIGNTGIRDQVNNHYLRIFGVSLAIGALGAIAGSGNGRLAHRVERRFDAAGIRPKHRAVLLADSRQIPERHAHGHHPRRPPRQSLSLGRPRVTRLHQPPNAFESLKAGKEKDTMKRKLLIGLLVIGLSVGTASAQFGFGGIVYDPTNYANALLRYAELQQQLVQLRNNYAQLVTEYNLALQMSKNLQNMPARYRALFPNGVIHSLPTRTEIRPDG